MSAVNPTEAEAYEEQHVHQVYEGIAAHFSQTRHKPWPVVERFLGALTAGSVGLDVGCGNGKYLTVNKEVFIIASDRSSALIDIATQHCKYGTHSAIVADTLHLPHPSHQFDFIVSIAVIHHLSSRARRIEAIKEIVRLLARPTATQPAGQALIFAWALEQRTSRRGWDHGDDQDVLVPWILKQPNAPEAHPPKTFQRFYHLYQQGELQDDAAEAGALVSESGYDRDNWWVVVQPKS